jgi:hypothetical protein
MQRYESLLAALAATSLVGALAASIRETPALSDAGD